MGTKEQILRRWAGIDHKTVLNAMEEYAYQFKEENLKLRKAINLIETNFPKEVLSDQMGEYYDVFKNLL